MTPSKEVAEKFIKKRALGCFVKRVVLSVGHGSPGCVISEVADHPCVSDRPLFECYTMHAAWIAGSRNPYAKLKKAVRDSNEFQPLTGTKIKPNYAFTHIRLKTNRVEG